MKTLHRIPFRLSWLMVPVLFLFSSGKLLSQALQLEQESVEEAADTVVIRSFQSTRITEAFNTTNALVANAGKLHIDEEAREAYQLEVDTLFSLINQFLLDSTVISLEGVSVKEMDKIDQRAGIYMGEIGNLLERFSREADQLKSVLDELALFGQRWQLTLDEDAGEEMIVSREERIGSLMHRLDSVQEVLTADIRLLLALQDRFTDKMVQLQEVETRVQAMKEEVGQQMFVRDQPILFLDLGSLGDTALIQAHREKLGSGIKSDYELLRSEYGRPLITFMLILLLVVGLAVWYMNNLEEQMDLETFKLTLEHQAIVNAPVVSILFTTTLLLRFILADLPVTFMNMDLSIMMVTMAIMVVRLFGSSSVRWVTGLVLAFMLAFLYDLLYYPDIWMRLLLLCISALLIWLFIWALRKKPFSEYLGSKLVARFFRLLLISFLALETISLVANIVGAFQLAEFFALLPIQVTILAIATMVAIQMGDAIVYLCLASNALQRFNFIREGFEKIYRNLVRLVDFLLWINFIVIILKFLRIQDVVFDWGSGILNDGIKIGQVEITLANIFILLFVIWLSIVITRMVTSILEKDVFTRVKMAKGVPSTIVLLLRIALISAGFFLAMAAAGMKLTNLSIVLGAFSVGIGFGLQNIFNNMVSGLILAFERPLKVGDVVQVGDLLGTVRSIGLRSSIIRTFDGAEVIVPNGNLISDQVTNWTLSDYTRRMDIRVGVAYGTDPERVMDMMLEVAEAHEYVRSTPRPSVYFFEFGESSLDFRLLAWTHVDHKLETESEIKVEVNRRLKEMGIEIPFPQRDVHIRDAVEPVKAAPEKKTAAGGKSGSPTGKSAAEKSGSATAKAPEGKTAGKEQEGKKENTTGESSPKKTGASSPSTRKKRGAGGMA